MCEFFEPHLQKWVSARTDLVRDERGAVERIVHSLTDISERKEIERMKNDFVSCVSHELRTPLSSLRGFAELMLQREYPAEKRRHFLEIIHKESRRLGDLVNDVLDLQRIEAGRTALQIGPVSLAEVARETAELFSTPGQGHSIVNDVSPEFAPVLADLEAVRQILRNLVSNAVKYSPQGGEIRIGVREQDGQALTWVSDQGIGIPAELLPHIFSKFYRAPETAARKIGGTGLGLAVVRGLVEAHHGTVWVESVPQQGSVFFFTLPFAQCAQAPEAA
jgi:signal transduction histidine kinase